MHDLTHPVEKNWLWMLTGSDRTPGGVRPIMRDLTRLVEKNRLRMLTGSGWTLGVVRPVISGVCPVIT